MNLTVVIPTHGNTAGIIRTIWTMTMHAPYQCAVLVANTDKEKRDELILELGKVPACHGALEMATHTNVCEIVQTYVRTPFMAIVHDDVAFVPGSDDFWKNLIALASYPEVKMAIPCFNGTVGWADVTNVNAPRFVENQAAIDVPVIVMKAADYGMNILGNRTMVCDRRCYVQHYGTMGAHEVGNPRLWIPRQKCNGVAGKVLEALEDGQNEMGTLPLLLLHRDGFSTTAIRYFLNSLCRRLEPISYLEIGTYTGTTLACAAWNVDGRFFAIDNICQDNSKHSKADILASIEDVKKMLGPKLTFYQEDSFAFDVGVLPKVDLFYYDGDHSYEATRKAFSHYKPCLKDEVVVIVDDWNRPEVREATYDGIADIGRRVAFEVAMPHWWAGYYVAVLG